MTRKGTSPLADLLDKNKNWAASITRADPTFFQKLEQQQTPQYLWIGCSDSRVPANQIIDLPPGEVFVHRNIANVVVHSDFNCLSVIEYAVAILKVKHIIVCGHYGCGGIKAATESHSLGLIDNWLRHVRDVRQRHNTQLKLLEMNSKEKLNKLCELNVIEQVRNVVHTTIVQEAWYKGQDLSVHGWIYRLSDGVIRDLGVTVSSSDQVSRIYDYDFEAEPLRDNASATQEAAASKQGTQEPSVVESKQES